MKTAMTLAAALGAFLAVAAPPPAAARSERDQVGQRADVQMQPGMSYIFFRTTERLDVQFVRDSPPAERTEYETARAAASIQARTRYERQFARWQREETQCRGHEASYCRYRPERPAEVSPETFAYPPIEMQNMLGVTRSPQFTRGETENTYLLAVRPSTYIHYGAIATTDDGPTGTCLCMGSVRFDVPADRIVDLGEIRYPPTGPAKFPAAT